MTGPIYRVVAYVNGNVVADRLAVGRAFADAVASLFRDKYGQHCTVGVKEVYKREDGSIR